MSDQSVEDVREAGDRPHPIPRDSDASLTSDQQLKAALWFSVGKMVDEDCIRRNRNATPQFIGALTEMVWTQIGRLQAHSPP